MIKQLDRYKWKMLCKRVHRYKQKAERYWVTVCCATDSRAGRTLEGDLKSPSAWIQSLLVRLHMGDNHGQAKSNIRSSTGYLRFRCSSADSHMQCEELRSIIDWPNRTDVTNYGLYHQTSDVAVNITSGRPVKQSICNSQKKQEQFTLRNFCR